MAQVPCVTAPPALVLQTEEGEPTGEETSFAGFSVGDIVIKTDGIESYLIAATGQVSQGPDERADAGLPLVLQTDEQKLYFAHFGNGQGFTSEMVLINPSPTRTVAGRVAYSDDEGDPLPVGLAARGDSFAPLTTSSVNFSVPPLGALTISTDGEGPVTSGAAVVTSNSPLGGVIRFNIPEINAHTKSYDFGLGASANRN